MQLWWDDLQLHTMLTGENSSNAVDRVYRYRARSTEMKGSLRWSGAVEEDDRDDGGRPR